MSVTSSGPVCDVCDKYIVDGSVNFFSITGLLKDPICCDACKDKVLEMSRLKDWRVLPEGALRRFYAEMSKEGKINNDPAKKEAQDGK